MPSKDTIERIRMLQAWYVDDVSYLIYDTMNNIYVCVCVCVQNIDYKTTVYFRYDDASNIVLSRDSPLCTGKKLEPSAKWKRSTQEILRTNVSFERKKKTLHPQQ